jgi:GMP synthase (glutamine-hydrolysing)
MRFLIAESEPAEAREARRRSVGQSAGETFADTVRALAPGADVAIAQPADRDGSRGGDWLAGFDAVFLTGSPLHLYEASPEAQREVAFMRAIFAAGVPAFGSCAGLQVATVAAGGTVRPLGARREAGLARRIVPDRAGLAHPLLAGRPRAFDALAIHGDEVETLPAGGTVLASNSLVSVQAAEIRHGAGVFWGVQYHPELSPGEIGAALRRDADTLVEAGLVDAEPTVAAHAALFEALDREPGRRDLHWRLGIDDEVAQAERRRRELRNFIDLLVKPTARARGRA